MGSRPAARVLALAEPLSLLVCRSPSSPTGAEMAELSSHLPVQTTMAARPGSGNHADGEPVASNIGGSQPWWTC